MKHTILMLTALMAMLCLSACAPALAAPVEGLGLVADSEDTYIDFGAVKISDKKIDQITALLDAMPNLQKADMFEGRISNENMDMLTERYPDIEFGWTVRVGNHTLRTDQTAFSTLHNPKRDTEHGTREFYALKFCKKLEALDLGHNKITDISFLSEHKNLKVLILACNKILDISVLAELTELEYLELFTNKFTDITPLSGLTNLIDLNLSNCGITDLTPLYNLPKLDRFRLCMNGLLSDEQRREFESVYPDATIGWATHPTGEGWREHHRYDTIYRIFHSNVYEPFMTEPPAEDAANEEETK